MFHHFCKWIQKKNNDDDHTGCQSRQGNPDGFTSESRVLDIQRVLLLHAERLYTLEKARNDAVMEKLGLSGQDHTQPAPQPPAACRRNSKSSLRRRLSPLLNVEHLNQNRRSPKSMNEEEDSFWEEVPHGRDTSPPASISSHLSPTPPSPQAKPLTRTRMSRLPVFSFAADKEVTNGFRLQSAKKKVKAIEETLGRLQHSSILSPLPPAATRKIPAKVLLAPRESSTMALLATTPPKVPQNKKGGSQSGKSLHPAKATNGAGKKTTSDRLPTVKAEKDELQPPSNPVESLSLSFQLLSSDDWIKKMEGLKTLQALARYQPETLKTKLHEVCLVLIEEVNNLRSTVSCAAINTLADLFLHFQKTIDPEVEGTGRALLLKLAQTTNAFIHQQANLALDAMVENCSYGRIVSTLLNAGLSHRCVAVRASMAQHLHQLADSHGVAHVMTAGKFYIKRFFIAVSKMSVDGAPEVRHHGQIILQELAFHNDFLSLWTSIIPEKDRLTLNKILKAKRLL
ncbi:uncharacterized protein LOC122994999 [Scomber scombrus]|uniref:Uncharacterized protein LOC122994999 n=1 Tax=Scomber scombrus TaxID=13677 RepID=A0AAV1N3G2_SCOSC